MTARRYLCGLSAIALACSNVAYAGSDPTLATRKAAEAAYVQSGLRDQVESAKQMAARAAKDYIRRADLEREAGFLLGLAQVIRTEQVTMRLGNGKTLTITKVSVSVTIPF